MQLRLSNPEYAERLVSFLESLDQRASVGGPGLVDVVVGDVEGAEAEVEIYVRVWNVLYPGAQVAVAG